MQEDLPNSDQEINNNIKELSMDALSEQENMNKAKSPDKDPELYDNQDKSDGYLDDYLENIQVDDEKPEIYHNGECNLSLSDDLIPNILDCASDDSLMKNTIQLPEGSSSDDLDPQFPIYIIDNPISRIAKPSSLSDGKGNNTIEINRSNKTKDNLDFHIGSRQFVPIDPISSKNSSLEITSDAPVSDHLPDDMYSDESQGQCEVLRDEEYKEALKNKTPRLSKSVVGGRNDEESKSTPNRKKISAARQFIDSPEDKVEKIETNENGEKIVGTKDGREFSIGGRPFVQIDDLEMPPITVKELRIGQAIPRATDVQSDSPVPNFVSEASESYESPERKEELKDNNKNTPFKNITPKISKSIISCTKDNGIDGDKEKEGGMTPNRPQVSNRQLINSPSNGEDVIESVETNENGEKIVRTKDGREFSIGGRPFVQIDDLEMPPITVKELRIGQAIPRATDVQSDSPVPNFVSEASESYESPERKEELKDNNKNTPFKNITPKISKSIISDEKDNGIDGDKEKEGGMTPNRSQVSNRQLIDSPSNGEDVIESVEANENGEKIVRTKDGREFSIGGRPFVQIDDLEMPPITVKERRLDVGDSKPNDKHEESENEKEISISSENPDEIVEEEEEEIDSAKENASTEDKKEKILYQHKQVSSINESEEGLDEPRIAYDEEPLKSLIQSLQKTKQDLQEKRRQSQPKKQKVVSTATTILNKLDKAFIGASFAVCGYLASCLY